MNIIKDIRNALLIHKDDAYAKSIRRFFKEEINVIGVRSTDLSKISSEFFKIIKNKEKKDILYTCEQLIKSGTSEEIIIAFIWAFNIKKHYTLEDYDTFYYWLDNYVTDWSLCDKLCVTLGYIAAKYPILLDKTEEWTKSNNRWVRRASSVILVHYIKRTNRIGNLFNIVDLLMADKDDLVIKGCGWALKEASINHLTDVFQYVMNNKAKMPRTMLRYAIEKMPSNLKLEAMKKIIRI